MLAAGILGYAYTCPDMIGGGDYVSFQPGMPIDEKLIVRSCQVQTLMPMMQFSVAPWRVLSKEYMEICRKCAILHKEFGKYILELAKHSAKTGEPIVRYMEYEFPHQGFESCIDQFMLGDKYLVAPVMTEADSRDVKLPAGKWKDDLGNIHQGPTVLKLDVPIERLPYFEKIK